MEHAEFVEKYRAKDVVVSVDKNKAGFMYGTPYLMPKKLRTQQALIRTAAFGVAILGVAFFFFAPWWLAVGVIVAGLALFPVAQKSAAKGVLLASLENPSVYQAAINNQVIVIRQREK